MVIGFQLTRKTYPFDERPINDYGIAIWNNETGEVFTIWESDLPF